tara:strand:- start:4244 stop:4612 length:369 start_codon:yes stop_codon:yes gene_type:complete
MKNKILLFISFIVVSCAIKIHHDIIATTVNGVDFYQIQCPYSTALHDPRFELPQEATCLTKIREHCSSGYKIFNRQKGLSKLKSNVLYVRFKCDNKPVVFNKKKEESPETDKNWYEYIPFID